MIREHKYKPQILMTYCPVCGRHVGVEDWRDYGMHLHCTEFYHNQCNLDKKRNVFKKSKKGDDLYCT